jgi:long-chain acyl-CoA synthetase
MMRKFEAELYLRLAEQHRVDNLFGAPTMFQMLATSDVVEQYDLSSVKIAMCGGAPLAPAVAESFERRLGVPLIQTYGQSETGPIATWSPRDIRDGVRKPGSVGKLVPGVELRVENEEGESLPAGEQGELVARSPNVMQGYIGGAEVAGSTVSDDGWVYTGDIGYVDEDGWIYITGRKRELIIVGGFNVYPAELENVLLMHHGVRDAAVVGAPDERLGEIPLAYVVAGPGVTEQELIDWTRAKLAHYKAIRRVEFVDELPRGATEKVLIHQLQQAGRGGPNVGA